MALEGVRLGQHCEQALQVVEQRHDIRRIAGIGRMGELVDVDADATKLGDRGRVGQRDPCLGLLNLRGRRCGGDWGGLLARHGLRHRRGHKATHGRSCGHGGGLDGLALLYRHAHGDHHCLRSLLAHGRTSHGFGLECSRENGVASVSTLPAKAELKTASAFTIPLLAMRAAGSHFPNAAFIAFASAPHCSLRFSRYPCVVSALPLRNTCNAP